MKGREPDLREVTCEGRDFSDYIEHRREKDFPEDVPVRKCHWTWLLE